MSVQVSTTIDEADKVRTQRHDDLMAIIKQKIKDGKIKARRQSGSNINIIPEAYSSNTTYNITSKAHLLMAKKNGYLEFPANILSKEQQAAWSSYGSGDERV